MLDSLVRVSRRVGQVADRFATDAERTPGRRPLDDRSWRTLATVPSGRSAEQRRRSDARRARSSTVRRRANAVRVYNTAAEATATFRERFSPPTNRSWRSTLRKCARRRTAPQQRDSREEMSTPPRPRGRQVESEAPTLRSSPFASRRFHVLLNSLFKVLFNFPSRYLCAIGLVSVFSLRWSLPPALGCILKQPDSWDDPREPAGRRRGLTPALGEAPIRRTRTPDRSP